MKKIISMLLSLAMTASFIPTMAFAEDVDSIYSEQPTADEMISNETDMSVDSEGGIYSDLFTSDDYQVTNIVFDESFSKMEVTYKALTDCQMHLYITDDETSNTFFERQVDVPSDNNVIDVSLDGTELTEYYKVYAELMNDDGTLSEQFVYYNASKEYEEFMAMTPDDSVFSDNVVLDYGEGCNGADNFAVVKDDVKVVYVDSIDNVDITHSAADEDGEVELFSVSENDDVTYTFIDVSESDGLDDIHSGDKVLILPEDNINNAVTFVAGDVDDSVGLFGKDNDTVTVETNNDTEYETEDFFDYIRINVEFEADTDDIDFSKGDDDIELLDEDEADEDVELYKTIGGSKSASKSFRLSKSISNGSITDTVTIGLTVSVSINYSKLSLKSTTVTTSLNASNTFRIYMSKSASVSKQIKLGEIPVSSVGVVSFSVPIYLVLGASAKAKMDFTATQSANVTVTATYSGGSYWQNVSKSASSSKDLETEASVTANLGIKASVEAKISAVNCSATVTGEAGVKATGSAVRCGQASDNNSYHYCTACLDGAMYVYAKPSFKVVFLGKTKVNKEWSGYQAKICDFYVSNRSGRWYYGTGDCSNWKYRVVFKAANKSNKALSGVTVKVNGTNKGKTGSNGTLSVALATGNYYFELSKSGYYSKSCYKYISGYTVLPTCKLNKKSGSNETYYTIDDLIELTDDEFNEFIADDETVANTIFRLESKDDLAKFADYVNTSGRSTEGLRFVLNNESGTIDLTGVEWTPIGTKESPFKGEFDGNSFVINGLNVTGNSDYSGLFGCVDGAKIFDLGIVDANVSGNDYVGIFAGEADSESSIYDCYATGYVSGSNNVGGLVGNLDQSSLINCYNTADVSGTDNVGGIVGVLSQTDKAGQVTNVYNIGNVSGSAIAGSVKYTASTDTDEESDDVAAIGINYAYYTDTCADNAVGNTDTGSTANAYSITKSQGTGVETDNKISSEDGFANEYTLLDALNDWYNINGNNASTEKTVEESGNDTEEVETSTDDDDSSDSDSETAVAMSDSYNKWYADESLSNSGYPVFAGKGAVYSLSVDYVYEDGTEAKPSVILYLTEGQAYDVDSYTIDGYHTDDIEYTGTMPGTDLEYRVIYYKDETYTGSVSELNSAYISDAKQAASGDVYTVSSSDDLTTLANYVNNGGNTAEVQFVQLDDIDMTNVDFSPIGTYENSFKGNYNGQSLSISNISINSGENNIGLFGYTDGADLSYIALDNISITGNDNVGTIAGYAVSTKINLSKASGNVSGNSNVGGLVGYSDGTTLINSYNDSSVSGADTLGGIAGSFVSGEMLNDYNLGAVGTEVSKNAGGIVGHASNAVIENNYNAGTVSGNSSIGGIAGVATSGIRYCYSLDTSAFALVGDGDIASCSKFTSADAVSSLPDTLNEWISSKASKDYYTWSLTDTYPIFNSAYNGWLTDLSLESNKLSFVYNSEDEPDGILYVAIYDSNGNLIKCATYNETGNYTVNMDSNAYYVKAFLWDSDMAPKKTPIELSCQ